MDQELIKFKAGNYRLHVFIEELRALVPVKGRDHVDPVVKATAFGKEKSSQEHFFFSHSEHEDERLQIGVYDKSSLFRDSLIGLCEVDLTFVYSQLRHALLHKWLVLSNTTDEEFDTTKGYLKVGISYLHESDLPVDLDTKDEDDKDMLIPPHIKPRVGQLIIAVLKAECLPVLDKGGSIDPYCVCSFAGCELRTSTISDVAANLSVYWFEEMLMPVIFPTITRTIKISLWDHDTMTEDDLVGSISLDIDGISSESQYLWGDLYGAPDLVENDEALVMNTHPELASHWRGRVLFKTWIQYTPDVFKKTQPIEDMDSEKLAVRNQFETGIEYELRAHVFRGSLFPRDEKVSIVVCWNGTELKTSPQKSVSGEVEWFENCGTRISEIPNLASLPSLFVYAEIEGKRVSFARLDPLKYANSNSSPEWVILEPDKSIGYIENYWKGGFVRLKLYVGVSEMIENPQEWNKHPPKESYQNFNLLCHMYQCQDLSPSDSNGLADPYFTVNCAGSELSTKERPQECTLNPKWYKTYPLSINISSIEDAPPIVVTLYDHDAMSSDDNIGVVFVHMKETAPEPVWRDIYLSQTLTQGKMLIGFTLMNPGPVPSINLMPEFVDKTIEINILGLRDLKPSVGWYPVGKPFVRIDLNSLELPDCSRGVRFLQTQPFESGKNPNINSALRFKCKVPVDPLYAPSLTCSVCDYLFAGLSQPVIGVFNIKLADYAYGSQPKKTLKEIEYKKSKEETKAIEENIFFEAYSPRGSEIELQGTFMENRHLRVTTLEDALKGRIIEKVHFNNHKKEINKPNADNYIEIGYNRQTDDGMKHYRFFTASPLENTSILHPPIFDEFLLTKNGEETGRLKGNIAVTEETVSDNLAKGLISPVKVIVRLYIIDAFDLVSRDTNSQSDPFLRVKLGKLTVDDSENWQEDNPSPLFYKSIEFPAEIPGDSILKVQVWDHDTIGEGNKVGTAKIDLEDRFFAEKWVEMQEKPIETRPLFMSSSKIPQGFIRLWVEIHKESAAPPLLDISLRPPEKFEIRLIIWKSRDIEDQDVEGLSDLYVKASVGNGSERETDTHYRCKSGKGSWNYRMLFEYTIPQKEHKLLLQAWDKDVFSGNDFIGENWVYFDDLAKTAWEENKIVEVLDKKWVQLRKFDDEGNCKEVGEIMVSLTLLPWARAAACPVGKGRQEPNIEPYLPPPIGRFEWSLNPLSIISQLVGPEFKAKICIALCLLLCFALVIVTLPSFFSKVFSEAIF